MYNIFILKFQTCDSLRSDGSHLELIGPRYPRSWLFTSS